MSYNESPPEDVQRPMIGAVVLAAGLSTRMGQSKVLLPWADGKPIVTHIIGQLIRARVDEVVVVTGHNADAVAAAVTLFGAQVAYNDAYQTGEMLSSLKVGLLALPETVDAAMVVLGDQPRIQTEVIRPIMQAYADGRGAIVAPSYQNRRGHPLVIGRQYWPELLALPPESSPRAVINAHSDAIYYVVVETDSVLRDVDTPSDYEDERRRAGW